MKKILLVGQPNVGKSSLLSALTGAKVMISNYPGTTVDVTSGRAVISGEEYVFVDTPGAYSLSPSSEEEKVTDRMVLEGDYDAVIQVIDASALERSLIMTLQLAELGVPLLLALNFWEETRARKITVNTQLLEETMGAPVVRINPVKRQLEELKQRLSEAAKPGYQFFYDDHIELAISSVLEHLNYHGQLARRGIAVKLLEGDPVAAELFGFPELEGIRERHRREHPRIEWDIMVTRAGYASLVARRVERIGKAPFKTSWLDNLIINSASGGAIFTLAIFAGMFTALLYLGGWMQDALGSGFDSLLAALRPWLRGQSQLVGLLIENGFTGLAVGISVAVPYIGIFYLLLSLLEDSGVLARFIVVLDRLMGRLNLPGKAIIPLILGFGCTVPAIRATRVLPDFRDRLKVAILYSTIPCSSRSGIIFGIVGHYAGAVYAIGIYLASLAVFLLSAKLLNIALPQGERFLIEELPPYRVPIPANLVRKTWVRMRDFVYLVIPLLIAGGVLYGLIAYYKLVGVIIQPFGFLTQGWLGLPAETIVPLIYGFLQKDLVPAMLASALGTVAFSAVMTNLQLFTFGLASTFQVPCIIAFSMLAKEFGLKRAAVIELATFAYGMLWAGIIGRGLGLLLR